MVGVGIIDGLTGIVVAEIGIEGCSEVEINGILVVETEDAMVGCWHNSGDIYIVGDTGGHIVELFITSELELVLERKVEVEVDDVVDWEYVVFD
jgi:hypothetical protein